MIEKLFPQQADNQYQGHKLAREKVEPIKNGVTVT